jgi:hypothetical protein
VFAEYRENSTSTDPLNNKHHEHAMAIFPLIVTGKVVDANVPPFTKEICTFPIP